MIIDRFERRLAALSGPRRYAALFTLGALMTLSLPPLGFFPVLLLCVPGFIAMAAAAPTAGRSFLCGWAFGAGYFIFGLYWISTALFVDISVWWWVLPLSLVVGPALFALYYGFIPLLAWPLRQRPAAYALAMVAVWGMIDFARGHLFTGFPWNLPAQAWDHMLPMLQSVAVIGVYGLSLLTLFWAALPAYRRHRPAVAVAVFSFALVLGFGLLRLHLSPAAATDKIVRVVQPNIPQEMKWDSDAEWRNFEKYLALTRLPPVGAAPPDIVVWPETAVAADLSLFPEIAQFIGRALPRGAHAVLGTLRVTPPTLTETERFYNSVSVLDDQGNVVTGYDKHHLVPFGEYIPFRNYIGMTPLALAVSGVGDFTPGPGPATLRAIEGLPAFSPLICYEAIFSGAVTAPKDRPDWLVNVTNDGWYRQTAGPHQHMAIARLRAVEEGIPLVRAANTGISAIIDPLGRIIQKQPLAKAGMIEAPLPQALAATPYALTRNAGFLIIFFSILGAAICIDRQKTA